MVFLLEFDTVTVHIFADSFNSGPNYASFGNCVNAYQADARKKGHSLSKVWKFLKLVQWSLHNSNDQGEKEIVRVMETFEL